MNNKLKQWHYGLCAALLTVITPQPTSAQTTNFEYTGTEVTYTLGPGTYDITVYGAKGGFSTILSHSGGLGAEMEAVFSFSSPTTLTIMVGGAGGDGPGSPRGPGGGGGGTFVVAGGTPLIVAGGGGGGGYDNTYGTGGPGLVSNGGSGGLGGPGYGGAGGGGFSTDGGPGFWGSGQGYSFLHGGGSAGGGFYGASGGGFGGGGGGGNYQGGGGGGYTGGAGGPGNSAGSGGGSYIDSSAIAIGTELSGVASPDGSHNGEVIIVAVSPPMIQKQPTSEVVGLGSPASFSVLAMGRPPLTYQWQFGGTNISGATNSTFTLPSTTLSNIGYYDVVVSNPIGSTVSSNASLAFLNIAQVPVLVVYGPPGASYQIQSTTNFSSGPTWTPLTNVTLSSSQPYVYYVDYSSFLTNLPTFYQAIPQ
jgi:hypothetical protein